METGIQEGSGANPSYIFIHSLSKDGNKRRYVCSRMFPLTVCELWQMKKIDKNKLNNNPKL